VFCNALFNLSYSLGIIFKPLFFTSFFLSHIYLLSLSVSLSLSLSLDVYVLNFIDKFMNCIKIISVDLPS